VDVHPHGIAAEEGGGLVVRELDAVVADDEERLGCSGEEALRIEAGQRRGGFLLDQLSSASVVGSLGANETMTTSPERMPDGDGER
jgi:hypothetical protein